MECQCWDFEYISATTSCPCFLNSAEASKQQSLNISTRQSILSLIFHNESIFWSNGICCVVMLCSFISDALSCFIDLNLCVYLLVSGSRSSHSQWSLRSSLITSSSNHSVLNNFEASTSRHIVLAFSVLSSLSFPGRICCNISQISTWFM